jgi:DNA-binding transcriptional ArsR family regulator
MPAEDRVMLQNPNTGTDDVRIRRALYEPVRAAILDAVAEAGGIPFSALRAEVERRTPATLWDDASVGWYTTAVKLDLEAKGLLTRSGSPQVLELSPAGQAARAAS